MDTGNTAKARSRGEKKSRRFTEPHCTVEEFAAKHGLSIPEALSLHSRFGPSATELDLLMRAKRAYSGSEQHERK
ncbi:hypothetical protein [Rhizobium arenae]|uniref:hypothetical protein n=1 Tax=Pararhizobium arenae TaxID=1856850 RepID=UPI00094B2E03